MFYLRILLLLELISLGFGAKVTVGLRAMGDLGFHESDKGKSVYVQFLIGDEQQKSPKKAIKMTTENNNNGYAGATIEYDNSAVLTRGTTEERLFSVFTTILRMDGMSAAEKHSFPLTPLLLEFTVKQGTIMQREVLRRCAWLGKNAGGGDGSTGKVASLSHIKPAGLDGYWVNVFSGQIFECPPASSTSSAVSHTGGSLTEQLHKRFFSTSTTGGGGGASGAGSSGSTGAGGIIKKPSSASSATGSNGHIVDTAEGKYFVGGKATGAGEKAGGKAGGSSGGGHHGGGSSPQQHRTGGDDGKGGH